MDLPLPETDSNQQVWRQLISEMLEKLNQLDQI
jgi:hypothetical protein